MIKKLPDEILKRASLRGKEYAWPLDDIPHVIRACEAADLVNVGGQLQFRIPDGGTCECHWVEVDTMKQVVSRLSWSELVKMTAEIAMRDFEALKESFDFLVEGRKGFQSQFSKLEESGIDPNRFACFVWYGKGKSAGTSTERANL
tara:strand:- start:46 stop:483 length:438 start_codon:yes stop_codon:yes gene_type:complete